MKKIYLIFMLCIVQVFAEEYMIDNTHSSVSFAIKHLSVADTIGVFKEFDGKLFVKNGKITKLTGSVEIPSVDTFNSARDQDLQQDSFFAVKKATLESTSFQNNQLHAKITINNKTKEIIFNTKIIGPILNPAQTKTESTAPINPLLPHNATINPLTNTLQATQTHDDCGCYLTYGDNVIGVELRGKINRFDFDISPTTPKELLGEFVEITIILEASR